MTVLAKTGISGLVTMGSNGEAPHLNWEERISVIETTRTALDDAGFKQIPIIMGASGQSVRGTLELCQDAAKAGADYALALPPGYFRGAMNNGVIADFYKRVADGSPLPRLVYSFPAVVAGIEMDSDLIISISHHPNIVGTKFTYGDTGKLARVASAMNGLTIHANNSGYLCMLRGARRLCADGSRRGRIRVHCGRSERNAQSMCEALSALQIQRDRTGNGIAERVSSRRLATHCCGDCWY